MRLARRRRSNPIVSAVIFFILGIILIIAAIATDPNNITCDGQTMTEGDVCIHYKNGVETSENSIDQERQSQQNSRIFEIIGSVLCFAAGGFFIFRFSKARAALKNGAIPSAAQYGMPQQPGVYPPPQGGYPQQPGYPPPQSGYPQQPGYPPLGYPQAGTPAQPGPYPPAPNNYPPPPPYGG